MQKTYQKAKAKVDTVTQKDVKDWFDRNVEKKTKMRGWNSYIAPGICDEFEMDVFEMPKSYPGYKEFPMGLLAIDIFSKYMSIIPLKNKKGVSLKPAIEETFKKIGCKPRIIYTDNEGGLNNKKEFGTWFEDNDILHIVTTEHANTAERAIRTLKFMMEKRMELQKKQGTRTHWSVIVPNILDVYNNKSEHSSIKMTPAEGREKKNEAIVKANLEIRARYGRKYPALRKGDKVKVFKKKDKAKQKERFSNWAPRIWTIEDIKEEKRSRNVFSGRQWSESS
jgi:hypothetical protein